MRKSSLGAAAICILAGLTVQAAAQTTPPVATSGPLPLTAEEEEIDRQAGELDKAAAQAIDAGEYVKAAALVRQSIDLDGHDGLNDELLAQALYAAGKASEALEAYKAIVDRGDVFPRNDLPYAKLLLDSGHYAKAVKAYNTGIKLLGWGDLVRANGEFSIEDPQPKALAVAIHVALGANFNGTASWGGHSQDDRALAEYKAALALDPTSGLANYYYGFGLEKLHKTAEARAAYLQASRYGTGDVWTAAREALKRLPKP